LHGFNPGIMDVHSLDWVDLEVVHEFVVHRNHFSCPRTCIARLQLPLHSVIRVDSWQRPVVMQLSLKLSHNPHIAKVQSRVRRCSTPVTCYLNCCVRSTALGVHEPTNCMRKLGHIWWFIGDNVLHNPCLLTATPGVWMLRTWGRQHFTNCMPRLQPNQCGWYTWDCDAI